MQVSKELDLELGAASHERVERNCESANMRPPEDEEELCRRSRGWLLTWVSLPGERVQQADHARAHLLTEDNTPKTKAQLKKIVGPELPKLFA